MATSSRFNLRNPAVKRIIQEMKELQEDTSGDFLAEALETDIFEWHFVIRGPPDTEFEGGIYHGRILLPADYPFKPPSFMLLSPNGRFETNMKICLTISNHHPEAWQPSWSVRTALVALIAFMPTPANGALGALEYPKEDRRALAARSQSEPPRFGSAERQAVINDMHRRMLVMMARKAGQPPSNPDADAQSAKQEANGEALPAPAADRQESGQESEVPPSPSSVAAAGNEVHVSGVPGGIDSGAALPSPEAEALAVTSAVRSALEGGDTAKGSGETPGVAESLRPAITATAAISDSHLHKRPCAALQCGEKRPQAASGPGAATTSGARGGVDDAAATAPGAAAVAAQAEAEAAVAAINAPNSTDYMLTIIMCILCFAIGFMVIRKVLSVVGYDLSELLQMLQTMP